MITRFFFITIGNEQIILGPIALYKLLDSRKYVALVILAFALVLPLGHSLTKPDRINSDILL